MLINFLQSLIDGFGGILQHIVNVLPRSPFDGFLEYAISSEYLGYIAYFIPIGKIVSLLTAWGLSIGVFYVYMIVMRWMKAIE